MITQEHTIAPEFTLKDTDGNEVSLRDYKGNNIVLLFFPLAFTGVCTKELCYVRDNIKYFEQLDANVIAISVDSFFTLNEFKKQQNLNFTLLSDFNKEVSALYKSLYEDFFGYRGVSKRSVFLIDRNQLIVYQEIIENASHLPDFESLKNALSQID